MKNTNLILFCISVILIGCSESINSIEPQPSVNGTWKLDTINYFDSSPWLRDFDLESWRLLEVDFQDKGDSLKKITTTNSPDFNIFPQSSDWELKYKYEPNLETYEGTIEGFAIEGVGFRNYSITMSDDNINLIISTHIQPDCPDDTDCTLEVCCYVGFIFLKKESIDAR